MNLKSLATLAAAVVATSGVATTALAGQTTSFDKNEHLSQSSCSKKEASCSKKEASCSKKEASCSKK